MKPRKSDPNATALDHARQSRFRETAEGWYFQTREGVAIGPYESLFDAELSASILVARLSQIDDDGALPLIHGLLGDPSNPLAIANRSVPSRRTACKRQPPSRLPAIQKAWEAVRSFSIVQRLRQMDPHAPI